MIDKKRIENAVKEILFAIGEDPNREGLVETPARVADMYAEIFAGLHTNPKGCTKIFHEHENSGLVVVKDIAFQSVCEHHLIPFIGKACIAYSPMAAAYWASVKQPAYLTYYQQDPKCKRDLLHRWLRP